MFSIYPSMNIQDLNLDYILKTVKQLQIDVNDFVSINAIKYADPIQWDITRQYEKNTVVIDPLTGTAYISVAPVPSGVAITRTEYWTVVFDLGSFVARAAQNFTENYEPDSTLISSFNLSVGDWLVWGDILYKVISPIAIGDYYVIGSNIEHFTIEDLYNDYLVEIAEIVQNIGDMSLLITSDTSSLVSAINEVKTDYNELTAYVTPQMFGAKGDGVNDDTVPIRQALNSGMNVLFPFGTYLISEEIDIEPTGVNYSQTGRKIDFQKSVILATNNIAYCFKFKGNLWPDNIRGLTIKNVTFDGTVSRADILIESSALWFSTIESVTSLTSCHTPALIEFNSNIANSNGGLNSVIDIHGSNYVENTLLFTVESGADMHFDDFFIRNISNIYMGAGTGNTIKLNGAYLTFSTLMVLYAGNNANVMYTAGGAYLINCSISNVYHEPNFTNYATITASSVDCKFEEFHTKQRNDSDVGVMITGQIVNSIIRQFTKTKANGAELTDVYVKILGNGRNNTYEKIGGGLPDRSVRFPSDSRQNVIINGYNDPILYARSVNYLAYASSDLPVSDVLIAPLEKDVLDADTVRCKIIGKVTGTSDFTIGLKGTGINRTMLHHTGTTNGFFEINIDFPRRGTGYFEYFVSSYFNGVLEYAGVDGTPDATLLATPNDLALRLSVDACNVLYISEVVIERIPYYENRPSDT